MVDYRDLDDYEEYMTIPNEYVTMKTGPSTFDIKVESLCVLDECREIQRRKSHDYQNPNSRIRQADHYPRGINTITDMAHQKLIRIYSLLEAAEHGVEPNNESIEDSFKDMINYASFAVSYLRGKMDGQDPSRDMFNRKIGEEKR